MVRKIALAAVLMAIAGAASANPSGDSCVKKWYWFRDCTPIVRIAHLPTPAPEIAAGSAIAGLTLMAGAIVVLRGRRARNAKS